jgi:prepilin-type N-terminal cleavage/methylation domain-containing protein
VRRAARARAGFTLVEMLVVIAIIGVLAGLLLVGVRAFRRSGHVNAATSRIQALKLALEHYSGDFGDFPPTSLAAFGLQGTNGKNEGIESLLHCLTTKKGEQTPYFEPEKAEIGNTDADSLLRNVADSRLEGKEAFELLDPWGNPYVYFHHRDLRGGPKLETYTKGDGNVLKAKPKPDERTKAYPGSTTYQIWSFGPNGENEDGGGDDIKSW